MARRKFARAFQGGRRGRRQGEWQTVAQTGGFQTTTIAVGLVQGTQVFLESIPSVAGVGPTVGGVECSQIQIIIDLLEANVVGDYAVAAGLNVQTIGAAGTTGIVINPLLPVDWERDDWLDKQATAYYAPVAPTTIASRRLVLSHNAPVVVEEGNALLFTVGYRGPAASTLSWVPWIRWKQRRLY